MFGSKFQTSMQSRSMSDSNGMLPVADFFEGTNPMKFPPRLLTLRTDMAYLPYRKIDIRALRCLTRGQVTPTISYRCSEANRTLSRIIRMVSNFLYIYALVYIIFDIESRRV